MAGGTPALPPIEMKVSLAKEEVPKLRAARWRARTDLLYLCNHILGYADVNKETHGPVIERLQQFQKPNEVEYLENDQYDPKQKTWIYRPVIRHQDLEGSRFMLLLDPRSHFKTSVNVISHIIQFVINYPNISCLVIVANEDRAATIVTEIAEHFRSNELFRRLFPEHCPDPDKVKSWGNMSGFTTLARDFSYETLKVKRETTVYVGSIDAGVASRHFDVVKCSDIVDDKNSETADQCQKIANRFSLLQPVLVNECSWMYVEGTRYHANDVYGQIMEADEQRRARGEKPKYTVFFRSCYRRKDPTFGIEDLEKPFELDEQGRRIPIFPFDPVKKCGFSYESLESKRLDPIDGLNFNCQYLNDPTPTEASPLPVDESHPALIDPDIFYSKIKIGYRDMAVDFAYTQGARSDFTAISVMAWDYANRPYVEDIAHDKFTIEESVATLLRMYKKYRPSSVYIEDMPFNRGLEPTLEKAFQTERLYPNWVWVKRPGNQKKTSRVEAALTMWWKTRALKFVHSEARPLKAMPALKKEASTFPKGKHDDILDTLADLFTDKDYFGRLGPRDIEDPVVQKSAWEAWRDSEHGVEEINKMIFGPSVELPNWGSYDNKYGMP